MLPDQTAPLEQSDSETVWLGSILSDNTLNMSHIFLKDNKPVQNKNANTSSLNISVEVHPKLLISQSKFSGSRKFTLRYQ